MEMITPDGEFVIEPICIPMLTNIAVSPCINGGFQIIRIVAWFREV